MAHFGYLKVEFAFHDGVVERQIIGELRSNLNRINNEYLPSADESQSNGKFITFSIWHRFARIGVNLASSVRL